MGLHGFTVRRLVAPCNFIRSAEREADRYSGVGAGDGESALPDQLREYDGVVVFAISGCIEDRHALVVCSGSECCHGLIVAGELAEVAAPEFRETLGDVIKPAAQLVARRQISGPLVQLRALARDPAGPHVVDQDAVAVVR